MSLHASHFRAWPPVWLRTEENGVVRADLIMKVWTGRCDRVSMRLSRDHVVLVQLADDRGRPVRGPMSSPVPPRQAAPPA